jgi:prephenate dehydratase
MDIYGHIEDANIQQVLQAHSEEITCLGSYAKGEL